MVFTRILLSSFCGSVRWYPCAFYGVRFVCSLLNSDSIGANSTFSCGGNNGGGGGSDDDNDCQQETQLTQQGFVISFSICQNQLGLRRELRSQVL